MARAEVETMSEALGEADPPAAASLDMGSPSFLEDPYTAYAQLRSIGPVVNQDKTGWMVSGYDEVYEVLRSPHASVETGRYLADGQMKDQGHAIFGDAPARVLQGNMVTKDRPDHDRLRRLVSQAFTPKAITALTPKIEALVDARLDAIEEAGEVNLAEALAMPVPFETICAMLGIPEADAPRALQATEKMMQFLQPGLDADAIAQVREGDNELGEMILQHIAEKRRNPGDDILTGLIAAEEEGDKLTDAELVANTGTLFVAGFDTTTGLIGNGTLALLKNPDQLERLRDDPSLIDNAVLEFLRFDPSIQFTTRVLREPISLHGVQIPAGRFVWLLLASANRDERHFGPDAHELRIDRSEARDHLSFGSGIHLCLGAHLARIEGRIVFSNLITRFPKLSLVGNPERNSSVVIRRLEALPVSVR